MTRFDIIPTLIGSAILLAAIGCGDASAFDDAGTDGSAFETTDTEPTLGDELALACAAFCDSASECRDSRVPEDCAETCEARYSLWADGDDECAAAQIDLLNCYSAVECGGLVLDISGECRVAVIGVNDACEHGGVRIVEEIGEGDIIEVGDGGRLEADGDAEETDPSEAGDEEPGETEDTGPVFEIPEIPLFPEIPEIGPVIEFP